MALSERVGNFVERADVIFPNKEVIDPLLHQTLLTSFLGLSFFFALTSTSLMIAGGGLGTQRRVE